MFSWDPERIEKCGLVFWDFLSLKKSVETAIAESLESLKRVET